MPPDSHARTRPTGKRGSAISASLRLFPFLFISFLSPFMRFAPPVRHPRRRLVGKRSLRRPGDDCLSNQPQRGGNPRQALGLASFLRLAHIPAEYLPRDSNILSFHRRFELVTGARDSDEAILGFVFGADRPKALESSPAGHDVRARRSPS